MNKKITDLQPRAVVEDTLNFASDDGLMSYRVTGLQILNYILSAGRIATSMIADAAVTSLKLAPVERVPVGCIMPFAGVTAPTGYLLCQGQAVSRTTYAALFAALASTYGAGDGTTTFNLPDLRGVFMSGAGTQTISGITYTRTLGSKQADQFQSHVHPQTAANGGTYLPLYSQAGGGGSASLNITSGAGNVAAGYLMTWPPRLDPYNLDGAMGTPRAGTQTHPANLALNYLIKTGVV